MCILLKELFAYRQYAGSPIWYYFDRKTYSFVETNSLPMDHDESYARYIPLFSVDQDALENSFLTDLNDKRILHKWHNFEFCFEEFCQQNHLWNRWWDYYTDAVYQIAIQWCVEHNIKYRGENDFENK